METIAKISLGCILLISTNIMGSIKNVQFLGTVCYYSCMFSIRFVLRIVFNPIFKKVFVMQKINKCINQFTHLLYYCSTAYYMYMQVIPDTYDKNMFIDDYQKAIPFYAVQLGFHTSVLIDHIIYERKSSTYWEMLLHHIVAIFLILFSFVHNQIGIGIAVMFIHDLSDTLLCLLQLLRSMIVINRKIVLICAVSFLILWSYQRLYTFPRHVIWTAIIWTYSMTVVPDEAIYLISLLIVLFIMHILWTIRIISTIIAFSKD